MKSSPPKVTASKSPRQGDETRRKDFALFANQADIGGGLGVYLRLFSLLCYARFPRTARRQRLLSTHCGQGLNFSMISETISFLREQLEHSSGCRVLAADLSRDFLDPPNALVLSLLHAKQIQALQHRRAPRGTELSILLSSYFRDYSAALAGLDSAIGWTDQNPVLNAAPGLLGSGDAQVSVVVTEMATMDLVALWRSLAVPPLPSVVLTAKVLAER